MEFRASEKFADTRSHDLKDKQSKREKTNNGGHNTTQKTKDWATRTSLKKMRWTRVIQKGKQFLLHKWHPSCCSCYLSGDKSWMWKTQNCDFDKQDVPVVICDTDIA